MAAHSHTTHTAHTKSSPSTGGISGGISGGIGGSIGGGIDSGVHGSAPGMSGVPLYLDFYGALLTEKQAEILDLYYNDDYSLSEIAKALGVSRQAAHDALKGGTQALAGYEGKLGLVKAYRSELRAAGEAREAVTELMGAVARIKESIKEGCAALGPQLDALADIALHIERSMQGILKDT